MEWWQEARSICNEKVKGLSRQDGFSSADFGEFNLNIEFLTASLLTTPGTGIVAEFTRTSGDEGVLHIFVFIFSRLMTGDGPNTALVIDEIPFSFRGDTAEFIDLANPGSGPDVFFTFTSEAQVRRFNVIRQLFSKTRTSEWVHEMGEWNRSHCQSTPAEAISTLSLACTHCRLRVTWSWRRLIAIVDYVLGHPFRVAWCSRLKRE